jgi:hypothetical protein
MLKTTLSTRSKAFVSKSSENCLNMNNQRLSLDRSDSAKSNFAEKGEEIYFMVSTTRTKSNSTRFEALSRNDSQKSLSTISSVNYQVDNGYNSETSEGSLIGKNSENSCYSLNRWNVQFVDYNNFDQKYLIRKKISPSCSSTSLVLPLWTSNSPAESVTSAPETEQAEKKKRRRGGRKHKAKANSNSDDISKSDKENKYKTEMCKNWLEKGKCSYSVRCRFAHGEHELVKPVDEKPAEEYKSKPCSAFHQKLYCPYGVR